MSFPCFPEFKLIGLEDLTSLKALINTYPSEACEINLGNLFIWRNFERSKLTLVNENLCILCEPPSEPAYFLQPIGEKEIPKTIQACLTFAPRLSRIPEAFAVKYGAGYRCEPDRNNFDYVYISKDLVELKGKKYDGKRNRIKKFERNHTYRYLKLSSEHLDSCRQLLEEWTEEKLSEDRMTGVQKEAIHESLVHFDDLALVGGAIEVRGRIAAFSIGERLNSDTAVIHIEIVSLKYDGLSQLINREFIKNEWAGYKFINREQDIGIPGLRRAKLSYHPHHMVKKYNIWA